ncbi:hypothetical protein FOA52_014946 [Chlamydomonas sp. UWO 241]|nr:hypothetical protein FOA52_014946 [Chlamydomonas sp. UWO 241]
MATRAMGGAGPCRLHTQQALNSTSGRPCPCGPDGATIRVHADSLAACCPVPSTSYCHERAAAPRRRVGSSQRRASTSLHALNLGLGGGSLAPPTSPVRPKVVKPTSISAPLITTYIKRCERMEQLQRVIDRNGASFNHVHISAALIHSLAVVDEAGGDDGSGSGSSIHGATHSGSSGHSSSPWPASGPSSAISAMHALRMRLLAMVPGAVHQFDVQAVANTMYVMARIGHRDIDLLETLLSAAQYRMDVGTPQNAVNMLWACVVLGYSPDREWMALYYDAIDALIRQYGPQDLANTLWAAGRLTTLVGGSGSPSDPPPGSSGSSSGGGIGGISAVGKVMPPNVVSTLLQQAYRQLPSFSAQQLANTVWGLGRLGFKPPSAWTAAFLQCTVEGMRTGRFNSAELSGMVWGMARLGLSPPPAWVTGFLKCVYTELPRMPASDLAQILLALGAMRVQPPSGWMLAVIGAATQRLPEFGPQELANALLGIARLWPAASTALVAAAGAGAGASRANGAVSCAAEGAGGYAIAAASANGSAAALGSSASSSGGGGGPGGDVLSLSILRAWVDAAGVRFEAYGSASCSPGGGDGSSSSGGRASAPAAGAAADDAAGPSGRGSSSSSSSGGSSVRRRVLNAQELCNVLYAVARLGLSPGPAWARAALDAVRADVHNVAAVPRQAAMAAWALRRLGVQPDAEWLADFMSATEPRRLARVTSMELSTLLQCFAAWRSAPTRRWLARFWWRSSHLLMKSQVPPRHMLPMLAGMASLRLAPHALWAKIACRASAVGLAAGEYSPRQLASVARCLALLGVRPSQRWGRVFLLAAYNHWGSFSPAHWAEMMWALTEMKVHVPHEWLDRFAAATGPHLHAFNGRQLSVVVWTLSARAYAPSAGYLSALLQASAPRLATLSDAQLLDTVWHLNRLRARPRQEWVLALVGACRARAFEPRVEGLMERAVAQLIARVTAGQRLQLRSGRAGRGSSSGTRGRGTRGGAKSAQATVRRKRLQQQRDVKEEPQLAAASTATAAPRSPSPQRSSSPARVVQAGTSYVESNVVPSRTVRKVPRDTRPPEPLPRGPAQQQQQPAPTSQKLVPAKGGVHDGGRDASFLLNSPHAIDAGLDPKAVYRNLSVPELYELALSTEKDSRLSSNGALMADSYKKKGRSPKDKRVVVEPGSEGDIWWGGASPNFPMDESTFLVNRQRAADYLNLVERVYVVDGYVNWKASQRLKIRVVCTRPYHALFMHNMLIRPTREELADFGEPDFVIYNAGEFPANSRTDGMTSDASVALSFKSNEMVILGTQYAGEMKKGVFTVLNYLMPKRGVLSLHSGCNVGADGDVSMFFGLSGTGKTTLSADTHRPLIGDDEHCWDSEGVFNAEGGCYAKAIGLKQEKEPVIWDAIKFGTILENVDYDVHSRVVDYGSQKFTENTRICYPIEFVEGARIPCVAGHPKNIMLLCCDAFGVLPPVSKLTPEQAMYFFVSGYTAKVAGTEVGVTEPTATFSACFGSVFLVWHPMKYAAMLAQQMAQHGGSVWLINTGWVGGKYGVGERISLKHTRAVLDSIHSGELEKADFTKTPVFGLQVPTACPGVPSELLLPNTSWADQGEFDASLSRLGQMFADNFAKYEHDGEKYVGAELVAAMKAGGPQL